MSRKPPVIKPAAPVVPPASSPPLIVGAIGQPGAADGIGAQARFSFPGGIAVDSAGNIYVADTGNNTIRKISPSGEVRTLAGLAGQSGQIDDIGAKARFRAPLGIAVDAAGNLYVSEFANNTIRKISPQGSVITLAGSAANPGWRDSVGDNAHFRNPWGLAVDQSDNVYVADKDNFVIRKITPDGRVSTFAGQPGQPGFADGPGASARFKDPHGVAVDGSGNLFVADTANNALRRITPAGVVSTVTLALSYPESVAAERLRRNLCQRLRRRASHLQRAGRDASCLGLDLQPRWSLCHRQRHGRGRPRDALPLRHCQGYYLLAAGQARGQLGFPLPYLNPDRVPSIFPVLAVSIQ